jgi:hypothetical protein
MNNTFDKPHDTHKFLGLFPWVDFVKPSFLDIMIDISKAMADIEHLVCVIIGCTISFGVTSLSCSKNSMHVTVCTNMVWLTTNPFTITSTHTSFLTVSVISTLCDVISCFNVDWSAKYRQIKTDSLSWCSRLFAVLINIDSLDDCRNICLFQFGTSW